MNARELIQHFGAAAVAATLAVTPHLPLLGAAPEDAWKLPPEKTALKPGAGREIVVGQCLLCHSTDYITTQPPLTRPQWQASVEKMRVRYGAPIPTNSLPLLIDYLTTAYGKPAPAP